ncbi:MAG: TIGR02996 domain-containing protein [Planctomycetia bacterium]|nr:TIGR02996 domain-containing protein [Planctomycetia bacterium]
MSDTLAALRAAIIDAPADRIARLVFADALDEIGSPSDAARAEFIRAQIAMEPLYDGDPERERLAARCQELFAENWIDWWRPVCVSMGLPEPYVPRHGLRARLRRLFGEERPIGAPYKVSSIAWSVGSEEHAVAAQFIAGFPELLYFHVYPPNASPELFARWAEAVPLARLRLGPIFNDESGSLVDGPHLVKVVELTFDRLSARAAAILARSPHTKGLTALNLLPLDPDAEVVQMLVHNPTWAGLRSLRLTGVISPAALHTLAESCTLEQLEELSFGVAEVPEPLHIPGGAIGAVVDDIIASFLRTRPMPPGPIIGADYWPALFELARSPVLPRLRRLWVHDFDLLSPFAETLLYERDPGNFEPFFSDECVLAVADALNPDKLERLELPRSRLSFACWEELARRFGPRVVLT